MLSWLIPYMFVPLRKTIPVVSVLIARLYHISDKPASVLRLREIFRQKPKHQAAVPSFQYFFVTNVITESKIFGMAICAGNEVNNIHGLPDKSSMIRADVFAQSHY